MKFHEARGMTPDAGSIPGRKNGIKAAQPRHNFEPDLTALPSAQKKTKTL
jgi:hypothetical protein